MLSRVVTLPIDAEGQYYLYVVVNDGEAICEGDNVNSNYLVSELINVELSPYPDLFITNANTPESVVAGTTASVTYTVVNQGIRDVTQDESWTDGIYISNSPQFSLETATPLSLITRHGPLAINGSYEVSKTVDVPYNLANDNYFIYIVTDKNDNLFEYVGEYNNVYQSTSFPAQEYSLDLTVTSIEGDTEIEWNQQVAYSYTVTNLGSRPSVNAFTDKIFLSTDIAYDADDILLGSHTISGIGAGGSWSGSYTRNFNVRIPYGCTGDYYILVVTDANGSNPDSNPENNVLAYDVQISTIPVPDLEVSEVTVLTEYPACGQPVLVSYKVTNVGDGPTYGTYVDRACYSRNTYENGTMISSVTRSDVLGVGEYYYDTVSFVVPVPATGNYAIYVKANHNEGMYEPDYENNLFMVPLVVNLNAPGDLVVSSINHPSYVMAGEEVTISWSVRNLGPNELSGVGYSDVVYLSTDTIFDSDDKLLGNFTYEYFDPSGICATGVTFPLYTDITHTLSTMITGVQEGDYYIIVLCDARNTFYEVNEHNNVGYSVTPISVELPILPFNTLVEFDMNNFQYKDFKLVVGNNISETVRIWVTSDNAEMGSVNNIYVLKDAVGTNLDYDFSTDGQMTSNSEVYIPRTERGFYGVSVLGYSPVNDEQHMTIEADILPFEVRKITPNYGGNTGKVTVKLIGSKFRYDMAVQLFKYHAVGNEMVKDSIVADTLYFVNFNEAYATFNLKGADLGIYSLRADNFCDGSAYLDDCFRVVEGEPVDQALATNLIIPVGLRANRFCCLTLEYGNIGNVDIEIPRLRLRSEGGSWIGLRRGELNIHKTQLDIPITGEPAGILRPGVRHTITIYCYTSGELHFYIDVNEQIEVHEYVKNTMTY